MCVLLPELEGGRAVETPILFCKLSVCHVAGSINYHFGTELGCARLFIYYIDDTRAFLLWFFISRIHTFENWA